MNKLTRRERMLIHLLVVLIVLSVSLMLLIVPSVTNWLSLKNELETDLRPKYTALQQEAARRDVVYAQREAVRAEYEAALEILPAKMGNEEIDRLVTGLCSANGLEVDGLTLDDQPSPEGFSTVICRRVTAQVIGSLTSVAALLKSTEDSVSLRVEDYTQTGTLVTINFLVYMMQ